MSFTLKYRILRNGNICDLHARPEMPTHGEQTSTASEMNETEQNNETSAGFSLDMIEQRSKADLEPFLAQISALTLMHMMEKVIQDNSAKEFWTASTREPRFLSESPATNGPQSSRIPPIALMTTAGYSLDTSVQRLSLLEIKKSTKNYITKRFDLEKTNKHSLKQI